MTLVIYNKFGETESIYYHVIHILRDDNNELYFTTYNHKKNEHEKHVIENVKTFKIES